MIEESNPPQTEKEDKPIYKNPGVIIIVIALIGACCLGILLLFTMGSLYIPDDTGSNTNILTNDSVNTGKSAKLENVTVVTDESLDHYLNINGKIMFKNDNIAARLTAEVNLKDGSKISEPYVTTWREVKKNQWYVLEGDIRLPNDKYRISDVESIDFILIDGMYDKNVVYTWKNK